MALLPDISSVIQRGTSNSWLLLPAAVALGAPHALEPRHGKALMAGFIVAIRGTTAQAWVLGASAAAGHTIVICRLALIGLTIGDKLIAERAEPWLLLASGLPIVAVAVRLLISVARTHGHDQHRDHSHDHGSHGHSHALPEDVARTDRRRRATTGGLLPCLAANAVLLVCLQLKAVSLGLAMVAAFSLGLAVTLIAVGVVAPWGTGRAAQAWSGVDRWAERLPFLSG